MKILFVTSEAAPFLRTGGLGDVAGALPQALKAMGHDVRIVMPLYQGISEENRKKMHFVGSTFVDLGWRRQYAGVFEATENGVPYYFVDNEYYFNRGGLYGHFDDGERFAFFSKAALEIVKVTEFYPDVMHVNDWQTALVPVFLDCFYRGMDGYKNTKTVLTIHNIEFQGQFDRFVTGDVLGMPQDWESVLEWRGACNYLKAGIERANLVTTVSETYAAELQHSFYAFGLEGILREKRYKLRGVINGIDTKLYDPQTDKNLLVNYSAKTVKKRAENKKNLLETLGLEYSENRPLVAIVSRLTEQKGLDLVASVLDEMLKADMQLVVLGTGDWKYETMFKNAAERYPDKVRAIINFNGGIAQKIYGSADIFLMPSKYEPCGLGQMIAMRYGAVPVVRETGGLKDSVAPFDPTDGSGVGFTFKTYHPYDMLDAVWRALGVYFDKEQWSKVQQNGMKCDFGWKASAKKYSDFYESL